MAERRFRAASSSSGGNSTAGTASGAAGVMDGSRAVHPALHVDLSRPRHDQSTYWGRARHFMETVNPLNILASPAKLEEAARTVHAYKYVSWHQATPHSAVSEVYSYFSLLFSFLCVLMRIPIDMSKMVVLKITYFQHHILPVSMESVSFT